MMHANLCSLPFPARAANAVFVSLGNVHTITAALAALPAGRVVAVDIAGAGQWATPAVLTRLTALSRLSLGGQTQLSSDELLEQCLQPLKQLQDVGLYSCSLTTVPAPLSRCTLLTSLHLNGNELEGGWQHLQPLAQLKFLSLAGTTGAFESLRHLSRLIGLELTLTGDVAASSRHLTALRLLQRLFMDECGLSEVPAAVSSLSITHSPVPQL
jgi:Leucine-rich repeat (LRR) protein